MKTKEPIPARLIQPTFGFRTQLSAVSYVHKRLLSGFFCRFFCGHCFCRFGGFCHGGCKRYRSLYLKEEGYCPYADFLTTASRDIAKARYFVFGI